MMKKDKFGICYEFYAVLGFLLALLGQPLLCALLLGFVIVTSESEWAIKQVMQAFLISLAAYVLQLLQTGVSTVASVPLFGTIFSGMFSLVCAVVNLFVLIVCILSIVNIVRSGDSGIPWLKSFAEWAFGRQTTGATAAGSVKHYTTKLIAGAKDLAAKVMPSPQPSVEPEQPSVEAEQSSDEPVQTSDKPEHASDIEEQLFEEAQQNDVSDEAEAAPILTPLEDIAYTEVSAPAETEAPEEAAASYNEGVRTAIETKVPAARKAVSHAASKVPQAKKAAHTPSAETAPKKDAAAPAKTAKATTETQTEEQRKLLKTAAEAASAENSVTKAAPRKPAAKKAPKTPAEKAAAKKPTAKSANKKSDSKD